MVLESCSVLRLRIAKSGVKTFFFQINKDTRTYYTDKLPKAFRHLKDEASNGKLEVPTYAVAPYVLLTFNNETETEE